MNKMGIGITIALWAADAVGASFGKAGENIALVMVAIILVIGLIKARREK